MRVLADGRVRRDRVEWREVFEKFEGSGLSISAFCEREGVSRGAFTRWRHRLRESQSQPEGGAFVELPPPLPTSSPGLAQGELELSLPGGVHLRWRP